jgi:hypothetical protein
MCLWQRRKIKMQGAFLCVDSAVTRINTLAMIRESLILQQQEDVSDTLNSKTMHSALKNKGQPYLDKRFSNHWIGRGGRID